MTGADGQPSWPHLFRPGVGELIVTLHGYGGNEVEVSELAHWLHPGAPVLSPRGTVVEAGTHRWYGRFTGSSFEPVDIVERAGDLIGFLRKASHHYDLDLSTALVSGFSNGAAMALALGVLYPGEITQVAAFSGVFPFQATPEVDLHGLKVCTSHGDSDPWVSGAAGRQVVESVSALGATVGSLVRPGGHGITEEEVAGARSFFGL
jgi:phospholipase/carboxylesterase